MIHTTTVMPSHVTVESLAQEWTVPELYIFCGYAPAPHSGRLSAAYSKLTKADLTQDWIDEIEHRTFVKGHRYQVFARYYRSGTRRIYDGLLVRDADELAARSGQIEKVVEVAL